MKARPGFAVGIMALALSIGGLYWPLSASSQTQDREIVISVPGIPGPYCAYGVEKRLLELSGIERVAVFWQDQTIRAVIAEGAVIGRERIREAIEESDYPYDYTIEMP